MILIVVGQLQKSEVRTIAEQQGFDVFNKKDSTGICFIGERKFKDFLQQFIPAQPGVIQTLEGETVGQHSGLMFYTIGQRQGLGIGGRANAGEEPWFVVDKLLDENILLVAQGHDHPALYHGACTIHDVHWINSQQSDPAQVKSAKIRYRQQDQLCTIEAIDQHRATVRFDQPQRAITPGQSLVFYADEVCLGGGIIDQALKAS